MPTENAKEQPIAEKEQKTVDIDTSGPGAEVNVPEEKDESIVETQEKESDVKIVEDVQKDEPETKEPIKQETKEDDSKLEEYSKGVQSRIAKLTRKMREAERQRDSATEYARAVETQRKADQRKYFKMDSDYQKDLKKTSRQEWTRRNENWPLLLSLETQKLKSMLIRELLHWRLRMRKCSK